MPAITIQSLELTIEQKEILAKKYIEIFSEVTNVPQDRIYLFFNGYKLDEVAVNGVMFSSNPNIKARGEFNKDTWTSDDLTK
jgi:phenylpyruvate tautomerase PptA (4-oxalocrotonate tautomerase family)